VAFPLNPGYPMSIPLHGAQPDEDVLARQLAETDGCGRLGNGWRTEPLTLVGVRLYAGAPPLVEAIAAAYPPYPTPEFIPDPGDGFDVGTVLFCVPVSVAEVMSWLGSSEDIEVDHVDVARLHGRNPHLIAAQVISLWQFETAFDDALEAALIRGQMVTAAAVAAGVDPDDVLQIAATLWGDTGKQAELGPFIDAAIAIAQRR
jgi:hypothetical protein